MSDIVKHICGRPGFGVYCKDCEKIRGSQIRPIKCHTCGSEFKQVLGTRCPNCGYSLKNTRKMKKCKICGRPSSGVFCRTCFDRDHEARYAITGKPQPDKNIRHCKLCGKACQGVYCRACFNERRVDCYPLHKKYNGL
jgi:hypothetical protein